ncbi:MAG: tRNA (N6-isopentenyl adenosine(37)-C2)-methylthiotransferase MiaB [Coriobacteriaceae bacterium]|jgi:tRNA-2-methylthio-N6-dimethylallyladenosine synthase|uniref:tRNA (N6-isopentenyl adenosine(37)-C2)-methylthiotransferase MiaB n=1 Tax=Atopobium sp. oral taxon 416 TaxID=712157 RepID=UPI000FF2DF38|nr:tRNA (N6-isopentenyl adenosine(37)-C2)-methylthiotransferase MiaB [Atopobium sp. oral taxon 416]QUC02130.1 tRNA (N6-isopentenyl adenosine(37)-C2)-methylthiotransferase MiaB [Atopobium sp. oral taxon 416]RRF99594.1 MAG: tRNA (N6-isopentenyl adenosine(37)-C2)-methylthiotransferase MiaB [Coriobacteriaceae bacterium]
MQQYRELVGKTYQVTTFGCQMNFADSERVSGLLDSCGCIQVDSIDQADIAVYMTCSVREGADTRLYGVASGAVSAPTPPSGRRVIAVGGCVAQREGAELKKHIHAVDVVFGTAALASLPTLLCEAFDKDDNDKHVLVDTEEDPSYSPTDLPSHRASRFHAWVPIMSGCDNFCTYCIVPYVRGRERSRTMESIITECEFLVADGVREITLLGQNVNSYGKNIYGKPCFAQLLREVGKTGVERIRFTSSNPKDLSDEVIAAMAETPAVMPHLHLAVQSGSTRILKAMNRKYTREQYLALARRLRTAMPDLALSTDIIVGFPGETAGDFEQTLSLVKEVGFDSAFTFIYSRRPETPAAKLKDNTPHSVIQERFNRLAKLVTDLSHASNEKDFGKLSEVLVEGPSKKNPKVLVGHSQKNQTVLFDGVAGWSSADLIGKIVDVRVNEVKSWYLKGSVEGEPR